MITLHHLEYSQSFRVLWLLEELGVEYELKKYNRDPVTLLAPAEYKAISPLGTAPVITHDGIALAETAAIVDYILDLYPSETLRPELKSPHRARHLFWFHVAQGSVMPLMLMDSIFRIIEKKVPSILALIIRPVLKKASEGFIRPRMEKLLAQAEKDLSSGEWFGGDQMSSADILLSYPIESADMRHYLTDKYPNTKLWLERVTSRPAFEIAKAKDGRKTMVLPL